MAKKIHISIVDYVGVKAGLDLYNDQLAKGLTNSSVDVIVLSNYSSEFSKIYFSSKFANSIRFFQGLISGYYKSLKFIKKKSDAVIVHIFNPTVFDYLFIKKTKKHGKQVVCIFHDLESLVLPDVKNTFTEKCLTLVDHVVVHNNYSLKLAQQKFPNITQKFSVIPHISFQDSKIVSSKTNARSQLALPLEKDIVLFFGMIKPSKGLDILLKAMKDVDANLAIAGRLRNQNFENYAQIIDENSISSKVFSELSYISNDKRDLYFKAADLIVLPYRKIYQSGVLILALSYNLPVVMSDLEPNIEFNRDSNCALLFKANDSVDLADKINLLLADRSKMDILKINGYKKLDANNQPLLVAKLFLKLFEK